MPRGDQTGPDGNGPMIGRRMGACVGNEQVESNFGFGKGFRGKHMRNTSSHNRMRFFQNPYSQISNKDLIVSEIDNLNKRLQFLEGELKNLS